MKKANSRNLKHDPSSTIILIKGTKEAKIFAGCIVLDIRSYPNTKKYKDSFVPISVHTTSKFSARQPFSWSSSSLARFDRVWGPE